MMKRLLALALAVAACGERVGPGDASACSSAPTPGHDFCQTWEAVDSVPGSSLSITLRIHDTTVTGTGRYALEAGAAGTLVISGGRRQQHLDLTFTYDRGQVLQYSGNLGPDDRITGVIFDTAGNPSPLSFVPTQ